MKQLLNWLRFLAGQECRCGLLKLSWLERRKQYWVVRVRASTFLATSAERAKASEVWLMLSEREFLRAQQRFEEWCGRTDVQDRA